MYSTLQLVYNVAVGKFYESVKKGIDVNLYNFLNPEYKFFLKHKKHGIKCHENNQLYITMQDNLLARN